MPLWEVVQDLHGTYPSHVLDDADDTAPTRQHELENTDQGIYLPLKRLDHEVGIDDLPDLEVGILQQLYLYLYLVSG